jgi:hypothetical protein
MDKKWCAMLPLSSAKTNQKQNQAFVKLSNYIFKLPLFLPFFQAK